jgi:hypothetical protein
MKRSVKIDVIAEPNIQQFITDDNKKLICNELLSYYNDRDDMHFNKPVKGQQIIFQREREFFVLIDEVIQNGDIFDATVLITDVK